MKALTVRQPWAWALALGYKPVENRSTLWKFRGRLAIHAAAGVDPWADGMANPLVQGAIREALAGPDRAQADDLFQARGAIIGLVTVLDVHRAVDGCCPSGWAEPADGRKVHMVCSSATPLPQPVPAVGALGLWDVPADVEEAVLQGLAPW